MTNTRDHGGGLDAAMARYGGLRPNWLDLSTGINPLSYPTGEITEAAWSSLPDQAAMDRLLSAARAFWSVPEGAQIIAAAGASALIARMPSLGQNDGPVYIPAPTYNEHAAAFAASGRLVVQDAGAPVHVYVHPNNPDGRLWDVTPASADAPRSLTVIDESFCDVTPEHTHIANTADDGVVVLKSFGKFWGLAGLRLGFAIGTPATFAQHGSNPALGDQLGPWAVAGPALEIGARALEDQAWAAATRARLAEDAARLDGLATRQGARLAGGTPLFRLYQVADAQAMQDHLARHHIWSRIFPYSATWLRLGLPHPERWAQLEQALGSAGGASRASASGG